LRKIIFDLKEEIKPYQEEGSKKEQVSRMFDNIAARYDLLNRVLSLGIDTIWRKRAIRLIRPDQPKLVLDIATGTGDVALEIVRQVPHAQVKGIDIAPEMLHIGRKKVDQRDLGDQIELLDGDSENIQFPDNTFDALTVAFGVRNFEHLEKGLEEMHRVLKPGARMVILEFSKPRLFPFKQLYNFYFQNILPVIGRITSKDQRAYTYLFESVQAFPEGPAFTGILERIGFNEIKSIPLTLGICSIYTGRKTKIEA
jgi:demethylmenaquinone methyltransferase/2-methoxy-6-polyprenyl-1,4-benzoquinol methylase